MPSNQSLDVKYVAHLARLSLSEEEITEFQGQLGQILDYIEELNKLNVDDVIPTAHAVARYNVWREDVEKPSLTVDEALSNAPQRNGDLIQLPKVVE